MAPTSGDAHLVGMADGDDALAHLSRSVDSVVYTMAAIAAVVGVLPIGLHPGRLVLFAAALVPWVMARRGVRISPAAFAAASMVPLFLLVAIGASKTALLLGVATAAWVSTRSASWLLNGSVIAVGVASSVIEFAGRDDQTSGNYLTSGSVVWAAAMVCGSLLGAMLRRNRTLTAGLIEAQHQLMANAATTERRRIAQDVHDVVAHSLAIALLHITGARKVLRTNPDRADEALRRAEEVGRSSLSGVRSVVGLLRDSDAGADVGPLADARDVAGLVDGFQRSGMPVALSIDGELDGLDPAVGAVLFRTLREALANVLHHAEGAPAEADVVVRADALELTVRNRLPAHPVPGGTGLGLHGIAERVGALGGELRAGPHEGWWRLSATIPLRAP